MNKLMLAFLIAAFLLLIAPAHATIYVGGEAGLTTISEAIEKASENETIIVYEGTYRENVVIDKPLILKASGNVTIEALDDSHSVVPIKANNVVFSGFNVKGGYAGIYLYIVQGCEIKNNRVFENDFGIALTSSSGNSILNNVVLENEENGIHLEDSSGNEVSNNIANKNLDGIVLIRRLIGSNKNKIENNNASKNRDRGITLQDSSGNEVSNNIANKNLGGVGIILIGSKLIGSNKNKIENNTACENGDAGIGLQGSSGNEVSNNVANKNWYGIEVISSNNTKIGTNTVCENGNVGIRLQGSSGNEVSNNIANKNLHGIGLIGSNNNKIENNTACENGNQGVHLEGSSDNEFSNNIANKNLHGIALLTSNNNEIENNTACENGDSGIHLEDSSGNEVSNNIANKNMGGIVLIGRSIRSNNNIITKNNIVSNKRQVVIQNSYHNDFGYNYWSDYKEKYPDAKEKDKSGIGDKPYEIDRDNKDDYPYMTYSGWLNVVITPEFLYM
jgi:parallel beta-helix repeat protein